MPASNPSGAEPGPDAASAGGNVLNLRRIYWSRVCLRLAFLGATLWMLASIVFVFLPRTNFGGQSPAVEPVETTPVETASAETAPAGIEAVRGALAELVASVAAPGAVLVLLTITAAVIQAQDIRRRDPVRRFSRPQRREGMVRAGDQCEMESGFRRRCSRLAEHGDHFYPWSKGGATSDQNFVAACARCNRAKGARIPSPGQQVRLEKRRTAYVTAGGPLTAGERRPPR